MVAVGGRGSAEGVMPGCFVGAPARIDGTPLVSLGGKHGPTEDPAIQNHGSCRENTDRFPGRMGERFLRRTGDRFGGESANALGFHGEASKVSSGRSLKNLKRGS